MKKTALTLCTLLLLSACGGTGTGGGLLGGVGLGGGTTANNGGGMASGLIQMYVNNQCRSELQSRNEWRVIALAMSQAQQNEWENKICGCASEEAPQQLSAADMTQLLSEQGRTRVVADVTAKTVTACVKRLYNGGK